MSTPVKPQSFADHARYVPGFHYFTGTVVLVILGWTLYRLTMLRTADALLQALIGVALVAQAWYVRAFPIAVQDRLICLEERLRIERLAPPELRARSDALTADQLISLRFASDEELPALVSKVLDDGITDRKTIKSLIGRWRADHMRA